MNDGAMAYDHSKNIGNEGDVVKHALLARVIDHLASTGSTSEGPFIYVECHAGRPEYVLTETGSWKKDVAGKFSKNSDRTQSQVLQVYNEVCIGDGLSTGSIYPGSAGLVFRILLRRKGAFRFILYETEPLAHAELVRYFYPWPQAQVSIHSTDGLVGISDLSKASLVLVDPPNLDQTQEIVKALNNLKDKRIEYVCWTPRTGKFDDGWREANTSAGFFSNTSSHKRIRVRWDKWNRGTRGCQITVSEGLYKLAEETILEVCRVMSWSPGIEKE